MPHSVAELAKSCPQTAQKEDLYVLLRAGPYTGGERNGGGVPYWIYNKHPHIRTRSSDRNWIK